MGANRLRRCALQWARGLYLWKDKPEIEAMSWTVSCYSLYFKCRVERMVILRYICSVWEYKYQRVLGEGRWPWMNYFINGTVVCTLLGTARLHDSIHNVNLVLCWIKMWWLLRSSTVNSLRWLKLCDMLCYVAQHKVGYAGYKEMDMVSSNTQIGWCLNDAQLVLHHYTTRSLNCWSKAGWIHAPCCFPQSLALASECCRRSKHRQDDVLQSSAVQFWWTCEL